MKRYFIMTNGYNMIALVDDKGKAACVYDGAFDDGLPSIEAARAEDLSAFDGCETAEECTYETDGVALIDFADLQRDEAESDGEMEIIEI